MIRQRHGSPELRAIRAIPRAGFRLCFGLVLLMLTAAAPAQGSGGAWQLVWSDEFNGSAISSANWFVTDGPGLYNNEQQYYHPSHVTVANGELTLTSTNQARGGRNYTSGKIESRDRQYWLYGRFEMRAKLPGTQALWPAFWLLPQNNTWPPEIDIMELLGHQPTIAYGTNHWPSAGGPQNQNSPFPGPNFTTTYNTFSCEWWPGRIEFFINGQRYATHYTAVPQVPMFLILNTAVGGIWPGYPNATTVLPQRYDVDYVRVWQWNQPLLKSTGFEYESTVTRFMHWQYFGNTFYSESLKRSGRAACKMYGNFNTPYNGTGVHQDLPASPGQAWTLSGFVQTPSWDRSGAGNTASMAIEWRNAAGGLISSASATGLTAATAPDQWHPVSVTATAPAGTASARALLLYVQGPLLTAGAVWWDDLSFTCLLYTSDAADE